MVNILVKYLKIKDLEKLTREGDLVKIFMVEYSRESAGRITQLSQTFKSTSKPTGFFALCKKFRVLFQHKFVEVLCISEFLKNV